MDNQDIYEKFIKRVEDVINDRMIVNSFIRNNLRILEVDGSVIYLGFENKETISYMKHYRDILEEQAAKVFKIKDCKVSLELSASYDVKNTSKPKTIINSIANNVFGGKIKKTNKDQFFVSDFNENVWEGVNKILYQPGIFNPFLIIGDYGSGKTLLLHYVSSCLVDKGYKIYFSKTLDFVDKYKKHSFSKDEGIDVFQQEIRDCDVLVVDNIHLLENKKKSAAFFTSILEFFIVEKKQIILTSVTKLDNIKNIPNKMTSLLLNSIDINIDPLNEDEVKDLLIFKLKSAGFDLNKWGNQTIDTLSNYCSPTIRSIEGIVNKFIFYNKGFFKEVVTVYKINVFLKKINKKHKPIGVNDILKAVCKYYLITISDLRGKKRTSNLVLARHISIFLIKNILNLKVTKIGEFFSDRKHSTIIHSIHKIENAIKRNDLASNAIRTIKREVLKNV